MNLFIDIQPSKTLPRVFIGLWALLILSFALFVIPRYALLTSLLLLLGAALVFAPCALWQQKRLNNLLQGARQVQFIDGCWYLVLQNGVSIDKHSIELGSDNVVWPWWIKLNYKLVQGEDEPLFMRRFFQHKKQRLRQLLIFRDAVSGEDFRHLSRVLRYYRIDHDEVGSGN
ncbi:protein YgfX [Kangiella koreensis]|nr:protein YgfX [Kangiella koreensis]